MSDKKTEYIFPQEEWEVAGSNDQNNKIFDEIQTFIINKMHTTGLVVARYGKIIYEFGDTEELSYIASCRKSILAMLYGKYVENGTIDLNKTLEEIGIDDIGGLLSIEKQATVKNLITARSGIFHPAANTGDATEFAPARGSQQPGTYFLYNNWDFNAAGTVFEKLTGKKIFEALKEDIAEPIGMQDFKLERQLMAGNAKNSEHLAYHMWFSTRDMARLGYLMLREGNWNRKQVISQNWIKEITQIFTKRRDMNPASAKTGDLAYGYMWWVYDTPKMNGLYDGAYITQGAYGQQILVIPKLDLVIAHKTKDDYWRETNNFNQLEEQIVKAIQDSDN